MLEQEDVKKSRTLIHLQFTAWPGNSFPQSPAPFVNFIGELLHFWRQQRNADHPIVVHCLAGAGRTGLLCLISAAVADMNAGHGIIDVVRCAATLCQQRRNTFRDREHLLFAYQTILYHAQDLLFKSSSSINSTLFSTYLWGFNRIFIFFIHLEFLYKVFHGG